MKNNKILITFLILFLQGIYYMAFAQNNDPCKPNEPQEKPEVSSPQPDSQPIDSVIFPSIQPWAPNEIIGLDGYDAAGSTDTLRWVSATQSLAYTVYFENDADLAMAAASKVTITVPLHKKLNFATFGVGSTYSRSSKSSMVVSLTCLHGMMLEIPLAHCVRGGMVLPPSGIKPPRKHSLT